MPLFSINLIILLHVLLPDVLRFEAFRIDLPLNRLKCGACN